jgi:hypothetical protein
MKKKQSSIDWLVNVVQSCIAPNYIPQEIIEQAKAMHKEEIRVAYMDGAFEKIRHLDGKEFIMPTDYYNETFGGDNEN